MSVLCDKLLITNQEASMKTSTPDHLMDFYVQFEEWILSQHPAICNCQDCDPELYLEMMEE